MHSDPYYQSTPAQWIATSTTAHTGLQIVADESLPAHLACRVDHDARLVQVTPGLSLDDYHWAVCRAVVRDVFGSEFAPEFTEPRRRLRAVPMRRAPAVVSACPECGHWLATGTTNLS
jgi:hypothetical protein